MGDACSTYGERRGIYGVLVGEPEGKRPLGRPWHRWMDNIKMYIQEVGWWCIEWKKRKLLIFGLLSEFGKF
jgi:hypothetical protein